MTAAPPLYDAIDRAARKRTRLVRDAATGLPLIVMQQDTRQIIEANKRQAAAVDRHARRRTRGAGFEQVASIPLVIWGRLVATGVASDPQLLLKWLSQRETRLLRTDDGRRLA